MGSCEEHRGEPESTHLAQEGVRETRSVERKQVNNRIKTDKQK